MGYIRAEEILPEEIIELIQQYVDGQNIYIPRKEEHRKEWGATTGTRKELANRNQKIYRDFVKGSTVAELAARYYLSEKSIQRVVRTMRA
ncbi:MAG: hypothetical protein IJY09_01615 [Lachnospiraceae bacterium]|nr:hypothetical protein [Lachnospiraceae bacterium]